MRPDSLLVSTRRAPFWRIVAAGSICFGLGSLTLVRADTDAPEHVYALADGANRDLRAHVSIAGELAAADQGLHTRLDTLIANVGQQAFDGQGNLRVAAQGTSQITGEVVVANLPPTQVVAGTVNVANLPAVQAVAVQNLPSTQNVNVVGGSLALTPKVADQGACWGFQDGFCDGAEVILNDTGNHGGGGTGSGTCAPSNGPGQPVTLDITGYTFAEHGGDLTVALSNSVTLAHWVIHLKNNEVTQVFATPLKFDSCNYVCANDSCYVSSSIVGFNP
jgi:hypothetical protein